MQSKGKELLTEFMDLIIKIQSHCENLKNNRADGKCKCVDCSFSRYISYPNSGCLLQEIKDEGLLSSLSDTLEAHYIEEDKYEKFIDENLMC